MMTPLFAPLLATALAALVGASPAAPAPPAAPEPPVVVAADCDAATLAEVLAAACAHPSRLAPPAVDGPSAPQAWFELALPAAQPRAREARSDTLFAVPKGTALELSNVAGHIEVLAWKRDEVRIVAVHGRRDRLTATLENGTLSVGVVDPRGLMAFGDVRVLVPAWMELHLQSVESPIDIEGVRADVDAGSVQGNVVVRQCRGELQLRSITGGVHVVDARGNVRATSVNNLVRLERIEGTIDAESINGDIQMSQVEAPVVDASSVNGGVVFVGPFQPRGRYRLASHNGNLRVGVPVGAGVDVSVATFLGAFESAFPVQMGPLRRGHRFNFTLGGGGSTLELESYKGLIQLLRPGVAPQPPQAPAPPPPPQEGNR